MEKIKDIIIENKTKILFTAILIIAIFVRIYKVQEIPHGLNVDEAGMAYDAYCLANYGTTTLDYVKPSNPINQPR